MMAYELRKDREGEWILLDLIEPGKGQSGRPPIWDEAYVGVSYLIHFTGHVR
jgi:hypothetical protein